MPILEELNEQVNTTGLTQAEEDILLECINSEVVNNSATLKELINQVTSKDFNTIQVQPQAGFVCKTKVVTTKNKLYSKDTIVYINICYATSIPAPSLATEAEIQKALNAEPNSHYKVPLSMGSPRTEQGSLIMDACINTQAYVRSERDLDYRLYILELAMEYVEEIIGIKLSREFTMPNIRSKGNIPSRLLKLPKPTLLKQIFNQLKPKEWKLQPIIKLENQALTVIILMPDNNFTSWTIDITTNNITLCINENTYNVSLPNQIDIKSDLNNVKYYKKSNHLVLYLKLLDRTQYL